MPSLWVSHELSEVDVERNRPGCRSELRCERGRLRVVSYFAVFFAPLRLGVNRTGCKRKFHAKTQRRKAPQSQNRTPLVIILIFLSA